MTLKQDFYENLASFYHLIFENWDDVWKSLLIASGASAIYRQDPNKFNEILSTIEKIENREQREAVPTSFYRQLPKIIDANKRFKMLLLEVNSARAEEVEASQLALRAEMCVEWLN